jgi:hypothetical protein
MIHSTRLKNPVLLPSNGVKFGHAGIEDSTLVPGRVELLSSLENANSGENVGISDIDFGWFKYSTENQVHEDVASRY